jgi:CheY-like chemotaxis protein/AraC-like DNA-binding protein
MTAPAKARPLVLAVEDDPGCREAFHVLLDESCTLLEAADGFTGLALVHSREVDLVLLDLLIPGIDGVTFLQHLYDGAVDVPVIVVTALDHAAPAVASLRLGAVDYITKPFHDETLLTAVAHALAGARAAAELSPPPQRPGILLVGCPLGLSATLAAALTSHARVEAVPATLAGLPFLPAPSADVVVLDMDRLPLGENVIARLNAHAPLAPLIVLNAPLRGALTAGDLAAHTVVPPPVTLRALLDTLQRELRPALRSLPVFGPRVTDVMEYVSRHYARLSLRDLSDALGTSPYYVSRLFHAEMGQTLKTYVNRVRVEAARRLLVETGGKIEAIASTVGCHDASHLSRLFVQYLGRRPGDLRRTRS